MLIFFKYRLIVFNKFCCMLCGGTYFFYFLVCCVKCCKAGILWQSFSQSRDIFLQNNIDGYRLSSVDQNVNHGPAICAGPFYADSESVHIPVYGLMLFRISGTYS